MRTIPLLLVPLVRDLSVKNLALLLAVGLVVGIFPVWGGATVLCLLASLLLRVNFPALQVVNQLAWPLQIAMLAPLARLGSLVMARSSGLGTTVASRLAAAALQAVVGWLCVSIPLGFLLYLALTCLLRQPRFFKQPLVEPSCPVIATCRE